jgi:hypothetical protein
MDYFSLLPKDIIIEIAKQTYDITVPLRIVSKYFYNTIQPLTLIKTSINCKNVPFIFVKEYYSTLGSLGVRIFSQPKTPNSQLPSDDELDSLFASALGLLHPYIKTIYKNPITKLRNQVIQIVKNNIDILYHDTYHSCVVDVLNDRQTYPDFERHDFRYYIGKKPFKTYNRLRSVINELINLYLIITSYPNMKNDVSYLIELYQERMYILEEMDNYLRVNKSIFNLGPYMKGSIKNELVHTCFVHIELSKIRNRTEILYNQSYRVSNNNFLDNYYKERFYINMYMETGIPGFFIADQNMSLAYAYLDYVIFPENLSAINVLYNQYVKTIDPIIKLTNIAETEILQRTEDVNKNTMIAAQYIQKTKTQVLPTLSCVKFIF